MSLKPDVKNDGLSASSKSAFAPDKKEACVVTPEVTLDCPNVDKEEMCLWPENNDLMLVTVPWCDTGPSSSLMSPATSIAMNEVAVMSELELPQDNVKKKMPEISPSIPVEKRALFSDHVPLPSDEALAVKEENNNVCCQTQEDEIQGSSCVRFVVSNR